MPRWQIAGPRGPRALPEMPQTLTGGFARSLALADGRPLHVFGSVPKKVRG